VYRPAVIPALMMAQRLPHREYRARGPSRKDHVTMVTFQQPRREPMSHSISGSANSNLLDPLARDIAAGGHRRDDS
jgi:hypothetical protein